MAMTPSEVLNANEDLIRALEGKASQEVLERHIGSDPEDIELKYLFLAQMLASFTDREQRKPWNIGFIKMLARQHGVDTDD